MRFENYEDLVCFERIRKHRDCSVPFQESKFKREIEEQVPGSIHLVADKKVHLGTSNRDDFKDSDRPGAVVTPPDKTTNYETRWVPFSSQVLRRDETRTVFLKYGEEQVKRDCVALPEFVQWFRCKTLGAREGKLSEKKLLETIEKLESL